jgi:shikimate kinase
MHKNGITLIGMPGSGKSTIGKRLAKELNKDYADLDLLIEIETGRPHQQVLATQGSDAFLELEEKIVLNLSLKNKVFATSGSIIYSGPAMEKIINETIVFYLKIDKKILENRLGNLVKKRGIVGLEEHGFDKLFELRSALYEKYADITIDTFKLTKGKIIKKIKEELDITT